MPIYEYQCQKCGVIEVTQRITDKALTKCPTCKAKIKKLISNTSFQLKGSGWYITDYARKGQNNGDNGGSADKKSSESKSSKSDSSSGSEKSASSSASSASSSSSA